METFGDRRRTPSLRRRLHTLGPLLLIWTATAGLLWASAIQKEVSTDQLFLDPRSLGAGQPWYTGIVHQTGVLGWTVAATAAAGGAWLASLTGRRSSMWFLASGAALTTLFLADEVIGFHADLGPQLGVAEPATIGGLLAVTLIWGAVNWREIRRTRWPVLLAGLGALVGSSVIDYAADVHVLLEDGPKLLGIVGWATYFVLTVIDITRSAIGSSDSELGF